MSKEDDDPLPTLTVSVKGPYVYVRDTHSSLRDLKAELESDRYRVQIPIAYPHATPPPEVVLASIEHIVITISHGALSVGKHAGPVVLGFALRNVYDGATRWLRGRFQKNPKAPASYITFYGPDGKPLKNILAKSADDITEIDPPDENWRTRAAPWSRLHQSDSGGPNVLWPQVGVLDFNKPLE